MQQKHTNTKNLKENFKGLWMLHLSAADYLKNNVGTSNWARFEFEGRSYSNLTINITKSVNSFMRELQSFSITHFVDHFRKTL